VFSVWGNSENGRIKRGLFECPHTKKVINADLNGAINMIKHSSMRIGASG